MTKFFCTACKREEETVVVPVRNSVHSAKKICRKCGRFVKWESTKTEEEKRQAKRKRDDHFESFFEQKKQANLN